MAKIDKLTQCIHSGGIKDTLKKGTNSPIYTSTAYDYLDVDLHAYPRYFNTPNQQAVVAKLCALENGEDGVLFSSGMAAISTVLFTFLKTGDHAVFQNDLYGGTHHAINVEMEKFGIEYDFAAGHTAEDFAALIRPATKLIYVETPSNPLLKIVNLREIRDLAKRHGLITIIDNTFASPINQNPLDHGIDVVVHSGTKYLGGHSDICCGAMISSNALTSEVLGSAIHFGGSLNAEVCYLLERSLKTLALRVRQQNENALAVASFLRDHPLVHQVFYPGLPNHPDHAVAASQMVGFGGMLSFDLKVDPNHFIQALKIVKRAMSLGGVETTICSPAQTSHSKMTAEARKEIGVTDRLLRLSLGIEGTEDLIEDFKQAMEQMKVPSDGVLQ